jgi:hypothetical protein
VSPLARRSCAATAIAEGELVDQRAALDVEDDEHRRAMPSTSVRSVLFRRTGVVATHRHGHHAAKKPGEVHTIIAADGAREHTGRAPGLKPRRWAAVGSVTRGTQGEIAIDLHGESQRVLRTPFLPKRRSLLAKVFLLHWNEDECKSLASPLRRAGHDVVLHWSTETSAPLTDALPDLAVISLERLPSHGRAVAEWLWEAKKRQHIPIIFAGGEPAKVQATRDKFPKARFCSTKSLLTTIGKVTKV